LIICHVIIRKNICSVLKQEEMTYICGEGTDSSLH